MSKSKQPYSNGYMDGFEDGKLEGHREGFDAGQTHDIHMQVRVTARYARQIEHWKDLLRDAVDALRALDYHNETAYELIEWLEDDDNQVGDPVVITKDQVRDWWIKPRG